MNEEITRLQRDPGSSPSTANGGSGQGHAEKPKVEQVKGPSVVRRSLSLLAMLLLIAVALTGGALLFFYLVTGKEYTVPISSVGCVSFLALACGVYLVIANYRSTGGGAGQRAVSNPDPDDYSDVIQLVIHADNLTWERLYYFLVFNSIMFLAWVQLFCSVREPASEKTKLILLAVFSLLGLLVSSVWGPIAIGRGIRFQNYYMEWARCIEQRTNKNKYHGIFTKQDLFADGRLIHFEHGSDPASHRELQISPRYRTFRLGAREVAEIMPWLFVVAYGVLLFLSLLELLTKKGCA